MPASTGVLRHSRSDATLVALSLAHAGLLTAFPSSPLIAVGLWWNANTISHNFVHLPFFRSPALNRGYSFYLTLLLGIPHSVWRERHLRHHGGQRVLPEWTWTRRIEAALIVALWTTLASIDGEFFATIYLPGYFAGLGLCWLQGHFEHARGTTSHYGRLYNLVFFNDGYHVEHHLRSSEHWSTLPRHAQRDALQSRWPPVLRWLDSLTLESLERLVLRSIWLQRFVVSSHERAFRALLSTLPHIRRVTIVGGGLFPRTALVLRKLLPAVRLTIVDASAANLEIAGGFLDGTIELCNCTSQSADWFRARRTGRGASGCHPAGIHRRPRTCVPRAPGALCRRSRLDLEAPGERRDGIVAVAQTIESHHAIRAAGLFGVLAVAKIVALSGRDLPLSVWAPFAFFWQDVLATLVFLALDACLRRPLLGWLLYGASLFYIAINVPIARVLGTPLTWNMMRAARGPLADSIWHHVTISNLGSLLLVAGMGVLLPLWLMRKAVKSSMSVLAVALLVVAVGVQADSHVETRGLQRNAFGALMGASVTGLRETTNEDAYLEVETRKTEDGDENLEYLRGAAEGRNVILIVLESTAARYLGLYGAGRDPMPTLTDLSRRAIVFDSAYAVYPESIKGLFSTLCSRYPAFNKSAEIHSRLHCASVAQSLRENGYRTALFHSGRFGYLGMAPMIEGRGFDLLEDAGAIGGQVSSSFGVDEPSTVRRMLAWIDSLKNSQRFFLAYLPVAGHHPYAAPDHHGPFEGTSDFDRYLNSLNYGDAALRQFIDGLRARNLDERTLFVIQGDHGEAFGQHPDNVAHSLFVYDENVRVPYVIAAPGLIRDPIRVERVTSTIDTTPTILDLLGYAPSTEHQGASLLKPAPRQAFFYTDYSLGWLGLRDSCWKYLYETDSGRSKLFDLCSDPDEIRDRAGDFESRVLAYRDRVRRWAAAQKTAVQSGGRLTTKDREASLPR